MSKIENLKAIKNRVLDMLILEEDIKKNTPLSGGFWKNLFKYVFLKPYTIKGEKTNEDIFFIGKAAYNKGSEKNFIKSLYTDTLLMMCFLGSLIAYAFNDFLPMVSIIFLILIPVATTIAMSLGWKEENKKAPKEFNKNKLIKLKENLFTEYNEEEIKEILHRKLTKLELENIFNEIKKNVSKEEIIEKLKNINGGKGSISEPYVLLKVLNEIIENKGESCDFKKININADIVDYLFNKKEELKVKEKLAQYK